MVANFFASSGMAWTDPCPEHVDGDVITAVITSVHLGIQGRDNILRLGIGGHCIRIIVLHQILVGPVLGGGGY